MNKPRIWGGLPQINCNTPLNVYKKIKYTNESIGKVKLVEDFLPSPEELVLKDETIKVTISLSKASVNFFKKESKKYNTQNQNSNS